MGEFGPILLITLVLSAEHPLHEALILIGFVALAVARASLRCARSARLAGARAHLRDRSQLAVRLAVVLVFALVALATELGLDLLLGGFVAGMITRPRSMATRSTSSSRSWRRSASAS